MLKKSNGIIQFFSLFVSALSEIAKEASKKVSFFNV